MKTEVEWDKLFFALTLTIFNYERFRKENHNDYSDSRKHVPLSMLSREHHMHSPNLVPAVEYSLI